MHIETRNDAMETVYRKDTQQPATEINVDSFEQPLEKTCFFAYAKTAPKTGFLLMLCHEKTCFLHMGKRSLRSAAQLISAFVFAT